MTSDVIFSSQVTGKVDLTSSTVFEYLSTQSQDESFSLSLTDEDSDWESISYPSSSNGSKKSESVTETEYSDSTSLGSQDLFEKCSFDMFKLESASAEEINENPLAKQSNDGEVISLQRSVSQNSLSIKCITACSQDIEMPDVQSCSSLPFGDSNSNTLEGPITDSVCEVVALVKKTGDQAFQSLEFIHKKTKMHNLVLSVIMCYPVREIWCQTRKCWQAMGAILLGDYTNKYVKLMLWGKQCYLALTQCPGNIIYINETQTKHAHGEQIMGSTAASTMVTLCSALHVKSFKARSNSVMRNQLNELTQRSIDWFTAIHGALCSSPVKELLPISNGEVQFCDLSNLKCGNMVHVSVIIASIDLKYDTKNKNTPCSVCVSSNSSPSCYLNLYLNGSARQWIPLFRNYADRLWEIRYVACCSSNVDDIELHTTIFSTAECSHEEQSSTCKNRLEKTAPAINSYKELLLQVQSRVSTPITLCNILVCSICIISTYCRHYIDERKLKFVRIKRKFAAFLNKNNTRTLSYSINCRFKNSNSVFSVSSSYECILSLLHVSSLKSLHFQAVDQLFRSVTQVFRSPHSFLVDLKFLSDDNGLTDNVYIELNTALQ